MSKPLQPPKLIRTADGSHSLQLQYSGEHYHSVHGALQESRHVFIRAGLATLQKEEINLFEMGFGTGLNALLSLEYARKHGLHLQYESLELYPLPENIWQQLNYGQLLEMDREFRLLHEAPWDKKRTLCPDFSLWKQKKDIIHHTPSSGLNLVYYDAFSPDLQPELWSAEIFLRLFSAMAPQAVLVTYSAKGQVRRHLEAAGFAVERLPGPPGKRQMLRARKD